MICGLNETNRLSASRKAWERLWTYHYEGAMVRYLKNWIDQLRRQRLEPFEKLAQMLLDHLEGILNYCRTKAPMGVSRRSTETSRILYAAAAATRISITSF